VGIIKTKTLKTLLKCTEKIAKILVNCQRSRPDHSYKGAFAFPSAKSDVPERRKPLMRNASWRPCSRCLSSTRLGHPEANERICWPAILAVLAVQMIVLITLSIAVANHSEPPRDCRRLQLLRRWSHDEQDDEQVFTRGPGPCGSDGSGSRERASLSLGGSDVDCGQDRLHATDAA